MCFDDDEVSGQLIQDELVSLSYSDRDTWDALKIQTSKDEHILQLIAHQID